MAKRDLRTAAMLLVGMAATSCGGPAGDAPQGGEAEAAPSLTWDVVQDSTQRVGRIEGFAGPESVRYDPEQDVWFVGNMDGPGGQRDGNGFISRVSAETGEVEALRFAQGTPERPLHSPRGMYLAGDTLWVVDADGVHGFHRRTGASVAFLDLTALQPGFLNDVALGPDGAVYVTDTGKSILYRIAGRDASVAVADTVLGRPNGITWDEARGVLVIVPFGEGFRMSTWRPGGALEAFCPTWAPGKLDGVEPLDGRLLVASQSDSSIVIMDADEARPVIRTPGLPADIGVDTRRRRIAVPYIALNRVDVWALPPR